MSSNQKMLLLCVVAVLIPIVPFVVIGEVPGERWLSDADANASLFGSVGAALLAADVLLPVPSSLVITMMGARLGLGLSWLLAWLGLMAGNLVGYAAGRLWPARWTPEVAEAPGFLLLLASRPVPVLAEAVSLSAGATRIRLTTVLAASAIGNLVYAGVMTAVGAALISGDWMLGGLFIAMCLPVLCWGLWRGLRRRDLPAEEDRFQKKA